MLQKLNKKLSRNHKGFSLVELMVAVAILAMAALGIFQAFGTGFRGMEDSKEMTVANNIAQKILEQAKSRNLEVWDKAGFPSEVISGIEYFPELEIKPGPQYPTNKTIVKAETTVTWYNRNGKKRNVIHYTLINNYRPKPSDMVPTYIWLSVTPSRLILGEDPASLDVTILDQERFPIDFDGQVNLSVSPDLGDIFPSILSFNSEKTKSATFTPDNTGTTVINATASGLIPDSEEIEITRAPAKIRLTSDPDLILKETGETTITVEILDNEGSLVEYTGTVTITSVSDPITLDDYTISDETIIFSNEDTKTITLSAGAKTGTVTVNANAQYQEENLEEGSTSVVISSGPDHLELSTDRASIINDGIDAAVLTVSVVDDQGNTVPFGSTGESESVELIITSTSNPDCFFDPGQTVSFSGESSKNINMTANDSTIITGEIKLIAESSTLGELADSNEVSILITTGPPEQLVVAAEPKTLTADGESTSSITITAEDSSGYKTSLGSVSTPVTINISLTPENGTIDNTVTFTGQLSQTITYTASTVPGTVTVTASVSGLADGTDAITLTVGDPYQISLNAAPINIKNNGTDASIITVSILDEYNNVTPYDGDIWLDLYPVLGGELSSPAMLRELSAPGLYKITFGGESSITCSFTSEHAEDIDVSISASDPLEILVSLSPVTVFVTDTSISVSNIRFGRWYWYNDYRKVLFDFEVTGNPIQLDTMDIYWTKIPEDPSVNPLLQELRLWQDGSGIFTQGMNFYSPATNIGTPGITLYSTGQTYTAQMAFNEYMNDINWAYKIVFRDTLGKEYSINFTYPITAGDPQQIFLDAAPLKIKNNGIDVSMVTVIILDRDNYGTFYTGDIHLSLSPSDGGEIDVSPDYISELGPGLYKITFVEDVLKTCSFTSSYTDDIDVSINASDPLGILYDSDTVTVSVTDVYINLLSAYFDNANLGRVRFEFEVTGDSADTIPLSTMDINCTSSSYPPRLQQVTIWRDSESNLIYNKNTYYSRCPVNNIPISITLSASATKYIFEMDFYADMDQVQWEYEIIFRDTSGMEFSITFTL
jgi:prepilin-type N-terminal cleavage/methylation domain-containing protein